MYLVIAGHSEFVMELAKLVLAKGKNKVVLLVRGKETATKLSHLTDAIVVNADANDTNTLDELELKHCDVFVAATESEKANVLAAIYAKNAGAKNIFVKIDNPESDSILEKMGLIPINAEHYAARAVELMITRPAVSDLVNLNIGQFDMIEVPAKQTKFLGRDISAAKGKNFTTIATCNESKFCFIKDKKIGVDDMLILLVDSGKEKLAEKELKK